jgi:hypothetical protein
MISSASAMVWQNVTATYGSIDLAEHVSARTWTPLAASNVSPVLLMVVTLSLYLL